MKRFYYFILLITILVGLPMVVLAQEQEKFDWNTLPVYHAELRYITDTLGHRIQNADGTDSYRVYLVDQNGNLRSAKTVQAQHKIIRKNIGQIAMKIGLGAGLGALSGLLGGGSSSQKKTNVAVGAGVGALTGALASLGNVSEIKKQKKSLKQQEKLLEAYQKNFTEEGTPVDAKVDPSTIKDLELKNDNTLSMTSEQVKAELESESFRKVDNSAIDELDAILASAE